MDDDIEAWLAEVELCTDLKRLEELYTLVKQIYKRRSGGGLPTPSRVTLLYDMTTRKVEEYRRGDQWSMFAGRAKSPVMHHVGNFGPAWNPLVQHAVDMHAEAPILVTNQARAETESIPFSEAERRAILGLPPKEKK